MLDQSFEGAPGVWLASSCHLSGTVGTLRQRRYELHKPVATNKDKQSLAARHGALSDVVVVVPSPLATCSSQQICKSCLCPWSRYQAHGRGMSDGQVQQCCLSLAGSVDLWKGSAMWPFHVGVLRRCLRESAACAASRLEDDAHQALANEVGS